jgi:hypothetical protein
LSAVRIQIEVHLLPGGFFIMDPTRTTKLAGLMTGLAFLAALSGCGGRQLTSYRPNVALSGVKRFLGFAQFYAKSPAIVWSEPDRASKVQGRLAVNTQVTETDRNERGWSKIKTEDGSLEGWVSTSVLSEQPVTARSKGTSRPSREPASRTGKEPLKSEEQPPPAKTTPEPAVSTEEQTEPPAAQEPDPSERAIGPPGPPPASGATIPPEPTPIQEPPPERRGKPEIFEPF